MRNKYEVIGKTVRIYFKDNSFCLFDLEDLPRIKAFKGISKTSTTKRNRQHYVALNIIDSRILAHRLVMSFPLGLDVDHINGDGLDNRKSNLRVVTPSQNSMNKPLQSGKSVQFKGVNKRFYAGKYWYRARIRVNGKLIGLGHYETPEEAAIAYNKAALEHFGEFARINDKPCHKEELGDYSRSP